MNRWWTACIIAAVVLAIAVLSRPRTMRRVKSNVTNKEYEVRNLPDAQAMADQLAVLELKLRDFLNRGRAKYPADARLDKIVRRWDGTLSEVEAQDEVAFSIDKTTVAVCLRDAHGRVEDENASMFVLLHELAHVATRDYGHSQEFWGNMQFLLELAENMGMYRYADYAADRKTYCGHALGASPLTCVKDRTCTSAMTPPR
jgi:Zn-dependent protease with chaperone function